MAGTAAPAVAVVFAWVTHASAGPTSCDAAGITDTWTGAADSTWSNGANWNQGTAPTAVDDVVLPASAPTALNDTGSAHSICNLTVLPSAAAPTFAPVVSLAVAGNATVQGPSDGTTGTSAVDLPSGLSVAGQLAVIGGSDGETDATVPATDSITGSVSVTGSAAGPATLTATGGTLALPSLTLSGNASAGGGLSVGTLTADGAAGGTSASITGALAVSGTTTVNGGNLGPITLNVPGDATLSGPVGLTPSSNGATALAVTGNATLQVGDLSVAGGAGAATTAFLSGAVQASTAAFTGTSADTGTLITTQLTATGVIGGTAVTFSGPLTVSSSFAVTGNATGGALVTVPGSASLPGTAVTAGTGGSSGLVVASGALALPNLTLDGEGAPATLSGQVATPSAGAVVLDGQATVQPNPNDLNGPGSGLHVGGQLQVVGVAGGTSGAISGPLTVDQGVSVAGSSTGGSSLSLPAGAIITGATQLTSGSAGPAALTVTGGPALTLTGELDVDATADPSTPAVLAGPLSPTGTVVLNGPVTVGGAVPTTLSLPTSPAPTINGPVRVSGARQSARLVLAGPPAGGTLPSLTLAGGTSPAALTTTAALTAATVSMSGPVTVDGNLEASTGLTVANGSTVTLTGTSPRLTSDGPLALGGTVTAQSLGTLADAGNISLAPSGGSQNTAKLDNVGLVTSPSAGAATPNIELNGSKLVLTGGATSSLADGTLVKDSNGTATAGAVELQGSATLSLGGALQLASPAVLRLASPGSALTGVAGAAVVPAGSSTGSSAVDWQSGAVTSDLHLAVPATLDGGGVRTIGAGVTLSPAAGLTEVNGVLNVAGTLDNTKTFHLDAGATVASGAGAPGLLKNEVGATLAVPSTASTGANCPTNCAMLSGVNLVNDGVLDIANGQYLDLSASPNNALDSGTQVIGGGALVIDTGAVLTARGTITFQPATTTKTTNGTTTTTSVPSVLMLNDHFAPNGTAATAALHSDPNQPTHLAGGSAGAGDFSWWSGVVTGPLTVDQLATEIGLGNYTSCSAGNSSPDPVLGDGSTATPFVLNGPAAINEAVLTLTPQAQVTLNGSTTIGGSPSAGFSPSATTPTGESVTIGPKGSLTVQQFQFQFQCRSGSDSTHATIGVPFTNEGTVTVTAPLAIPNDQALNEGQTFISGAAVTAPVGYTQLQRTGGVTPATQLISDATHTGTLTTGSAAVGITAGGLAGVGTVNAGDLTVGAGYVFAGLGSSAGTLTVNAPLHLGSASTVDLNIYYNATTKTVTHDQLAVSQAATLAGRISAFSSGGQPAYGTSVPDVITYASRTGTLAPAWGGTTGGLGWKDIVGATGVSEQLLDVAAPALGIAAMPVFTEFPSQRVSYFAVDNKTGVAYYDVRWQWGSPSGGFHSWQYPTGWHHTTATHETLPGLIPGRTYCFSVRVTDNAGNVGAWSAGQCTARLFDDQALASTGLWKRPTNATGFYNKTYSLTTQYHASLHITGRYRRLGLIAVRCPRCGRLEVMSGTKIVARLNLFARHRSAFSWVSSPLGDHFNKVTLLAISRSGQVEIDAVGLER